MTRWHKTETWRAFFPNLLAVITGIMLTLGTDRIIQHYQHQEDVNDAIAELKTDAYEALSIYKKASEHCRTTTGTIDSVMYINGHYEDLPSETIQRFLQIILEQADFTLTATTDDILRNSKVLQYMEPDLLARIDELRESENRVNSAIRSAIADKRQIRMALFLDPRKHPLSIRSDSVRVETMQFIMSCSPIYNYAVHNQFSDLAELIDKGSAEIKKTLHQIEAMGY